MPNDRYFEIYGEIPKIPNLEINSIRNFGNFFLLESILRDFKLDHILHNIFSEYSKKIMLMAIYTALEGNVLFYCDDWCEETYIGSDEPLTSQACSNILNVLTEEKRMEFFSAWAYAREQHEYLAYDVTSISSYSAGIDDLEYGYNRDGEKLPQINLGMYYGEDSMRPIFYCTYPGSINDKSHLRYMMRNNKRLNINKVKFVMDRGFFSKDNIEYMAQKAYPFMVAIPSHYKIAQTIIKKHGEEVKSSRHQIECTGIKALAIEDTSHYNFRSNIHLYYSAEKAVDEERKFLYNLAKREQAVKSGEDPKIKEKFFSLVENPDGSRDIQRDYKAIDQHLGRLGYFLIMTTDFRKTSSETLNIYRTKDVVEKCFDNLKNELDMKRLRVHSSETTDGKIFIAFLGLILRAHIYNILGSYIRENNLSVKKVLIELRKIKVVKTSTGFLMRNPLTKKQRDILAAFGKFEDDIDKRLAELSAL